MVIITGRFGERPFRKIRTTKETEERERRKRRQVTCSICGIRSSRRGGHNCYEALSQGLRNYTSSLRARVKKRLGAA